MNFSFWSQEESRHGDGRKGKDFLGSGRFGGVSEKLVGIPRKNWGLEMGTSSIQSPMKLKSELVSRSHHELTSCKSRKERRSEIEWKLRALTKRGAEGEEVVEVESGKVQKREKKLQSIKTLFDFVRL